MRATKNMLGVQPPSQDPERYGEAFVTAIFVSLWTAIVFCALTLNGIHVPLQGMVFVSLYMGVVGGIQKIFLLRRPQVNDPGGSSGKQLGEQFLRRATLFVGILLVGFVASYPALELQIELPRYLLLSTVASFIIALCFAAPSMWCRPN